MLFERIESQGLAHYSYIVGDGGEACVVDPRRDCSVYVEMAADEGMRITAILETHRNEDYVVGSRGLSSRTGAQIWHADGDLDYAYGRAALDGQEWTVGRLRLRAIHSPGHTRGSMSYLLHDADGAPWVVFTGDALFAGDVGRVDFFGEERLEEMAGLLYETLFDKLIPLGDGLIVCPAHGSGSVCGSSIASRLWTTIGLERALNPRLRHPDRASFVADVGVTLARAPYFRQMERLNLGGASVVIDLPRPELLSAEAFAERSVDAVVVDIRCPGCFAAAHVPGAFCIPEDEIPSYAGWFLPYDRPILLIAGHEGPEKAVQYLFRLGYDRLDGVLKGCVKAWHAAGFRSGHAGIVDPVEFTRLHEAGAPMWVLDVRGAGELASVPAVPGAHHIHINQIVDRLAEVPRDQPVHVMCATGTRAAIVSSLLLRDGFEDVTIVMGGMTGVGRAVARRAGADR